MYPSLFRAQGRKALARPITLVHFVLGNPLLQGGFLLRDADLLGELTARQFLLTAIKELSAVGGRPIPLGHERAVHMPLVQLIVLTQARGDDFL